MGEKTPPGESGPEGAEAEAEPGVGDIATEPGMALEAQERTTTLRLPVLTVAITRNGAPVSTAGPGSAPGGPGGGTAASRAGKLALYGGIAALGVLEIVEWPVAVGLGAGAYLLRRMWPRAAASSAGSAADGHQADVAVRASSGE